MKHSQNRHIPVILFLDKKPRISESTLFYFKMLIEQKVSNTLLITYAHAISKLIDYKTLIFYPQKTQPKLFLDQFIKDLTLGKTLNWKPLSKKALNYEILIIKEYSRWLLKHQSLLKHPEELKFASFITTSYQFLEANHLSKMFETKKTKGHFASNQKTTILKSFPIHKLLELLQTSNTRDKLIFSLMAFGGRRPSEILHLYTSDVSIVNNQYKVQISHPSLSKINNLTRQEYLLKHYNLNPRNEISGPLKVGFRGIKFENQLELKSDVYFTFNMEEHLVSIHNEYMKQRKKYNHHPYYFVNPKNGNPLTKPKLIINKL